MTPTYRVRIQVISGEEEEVGLTIQTHLSLPLRFMLFKVKNNIVKPESKSPIPCPNRPEILMLRSDQV